jgi:hypothetical protein
MKQDCVADKLKELSERVGRAVEAGKHDDWKVAEDELHRAQLSMVTALRLVELANDIYRGQMR